MAISHYDFKNLPEKSKLELTIADGKLISENQKIELKFMLYDMTSFSVEIVYDNRNNKIAGMSTFEKKTNYGKQQ